MAVEAKLKEKYESRDRGLERPRYRGDLPEGNDGLGLLLLGITGAEVLEPEVYQKIRAYALSVFAAPYRPIS
jgi:methylmalonyl-CoA mutase